MHFPKKLYPAFALFLFHIKVGIRLSLRVLVPVMAIVFGLYYILRPELFLLMASELFGSSGIEAAGIFAYIICFFVAVKVSPRILSGLKGWIRHLPISGSAHRRMAALSIYISVIPILSIFIILMIILSISQDKVNPASFAGTIFLGLAASHAVLPVRKKTINFTLSSISGILSASGSWYYFSAGVFLLILTDIRAGSLYFKKDKKLPVTLSGLFFLPSISWRALGFRLFPPYLYATGILGLSSLFLTNNSFSSLLSQKILRLSGTLCLVFFLVFISGQLSYRRPLWPWVRSLPWSAKHRILGDSFFLVLHLFPLLLIIGCMNLTVSLTLLVCCPFLSVLAAGSLNSTQKTRFGPAGKILPLGCILSLLTALSSWTVLFCLPGFFIALNTAVIEEKNLKVTVWHEVYHLSAGDSQAWSRQ